MANNHNDDFIKFKTSDLELERIIAEINDEIFSDKEKTSLEETPFYETGFNEPVQEFEPVDTAERAKMELFDWIQCIVGAIIIGIILFVFVGRTIGVDGVSMMNTLRHTDRIIISNLLYTPQNGDIIVFQTGCEFFGGSPLVKRVIAVEGQTVDINFECGHVYVDGILQCEPYIAEPTYVRANFEGPVLIEPGFIFVMGDNRNHSTDSRDSRIGQVDTRTILGKVLFMAIPGPSGSGNATRDWSRFGIIQNPSACRSDMDCVCVVECGCRT